MQALNSPYVPPLESNKIHQQQQSPHHPPPTSAPPRLNHHPTHHVEYSPSDPRFDRSHLSDDEFIKRLMFENKELKSVVELQSKLIGELQHQLKSHNVTPKEIETIKSNGSADKEEPVVKKKGSFRIQKPEYSSNSSSINTSRQVSTSNINELPVNKNIESLSNLSIEQQSESADDALDRSHTDSPTEVPMRSSRRRHAKSDLSKEHEDTTISQDFDTLGSVEHSISKDKADATTFSDKHNDTVRAHEEEEEEEEEVVSSDSSKSAHSDDMSVNASELENTKSTAVPDDHLLQSHDMKPTGSVTSISETKDASSGQIYAQNNKQRRSTSSVASAYKSSRIKPPGSSRTLSNSKSSADLMPPQAPLNKSLSDKNGSHGNLSLYNTPPNNTAPSFTGKESPTSIDMDSVSKTESFSSAKIRLEDDDLPARPELFHAGSHNISGQELATPYNPASHQQNLQRPAFQTPTSSAQNLHLSSPQTPGSSFSVLHTPKMDMDESALFIKPEEFHTIFIKVVSTIHVTASTVQNSAKKTEEPKVTMTINDRETNKEMWRIRKTHAQLCDFDTEIRPIVEYFGLASLPDKSSFVSTTPSKIEQRRSILQKYFNSIFVMPHIPRMVLYKICTFLSLDFVNPLDDFKSGSRKEGFLVRRYKGLGNSWKIRWCQIESHYLEIYQYPGGQLQESISLRNAQIGRQATDSVAEDKGYRHAFLIMESPKASKLHSTTNKHFFCAETDEERDDWVTALIEFTEPSSESNESSPRNTYISQDTSTDLDKKFSYDSYSQGTEPVYGSRYSGADQSNTTIASSSSDDPTKKSKLRNYFSFRSKDTSNEDQQQQPLPPQQQPQQYQQEQEPQLQPRDSHLQSHPYSQFGASQQSAYPPQSTNGYYIPPQPPMPNQTSNNSVQQYLDELNIGNDVTKSIFGRDIEEAYELSHHEYMGREIPSICYRCLDYLNKTGAVFEEGIFRLSGSASTIRQLKDIFNNQYDLDLFQSPLKPDINTVSGLFKTYLRELPNPILGAQTYQHLNHIMLNNAQTLPPSQIALIFRDFLNDSNNIEKINHDLSYIIFKFLRQVISQNQINRMNLRNVCIVFVPTLNISLEVLSTILIDFECIFENGKPISDSNREVLDLHIPNF